MTDIPPRRSILPPIYVAIFAWRDITAAAGAVHTAMAKSTTASGGYSVMNCLMSLSTASADADPRLLLALVLVTAWGCRLTYNFWRKGGYSLRYEDYRCVYRRFRDVMCAAAGKRLSGGRDVGFFSMQLLGRKWYISCELRG